MSQKHAVNILTGVLVIVIILLFFSWLTDIVHAESDVVETCEPFYWSDSVIRVVWRNAPAGLSDAQDTFKLDNLTTGEGFLTGYNDMYQYGSDIYFSTYMVFTGTWRMSDLKCIGRYPSGYYVVVSSPGPWIKSFPYKVFLPLVRQ